MNGYTPSQPFKMKYTNGKKTDPSVFPFKTQTESSPAKWNWQSAAGGFAAGGLAGGIVGGLAGPNRETRDLEKKYAGILEKEGLQRNFFGKMGFGGRRARERKARLAELQEQDATGIDFERIESAGGVAASDPMVS